MPTVSVRSFWSERRASSRLLFIMCSSATSKRAVSSFTGAFTARSRNAFASSTAPSWSERRQRPMSASWLEASLASTSWYFSRDFVTCFPCA